MAQHQLEEGQQQRAGVVGAEAELGVRDGEGACGRGAPGRGRAGCKGQWVGVGCRGRGGRDGRLVLGMYGCAYAGASH